jgi:DNA-binding Lrp family transcriptional regulator
MIAGYVLIQTEIGRATSVATALRDLPGVSAATSVAGPYDIIVRAEALTIDQLGSLVASQIQSVGGVLRTITCPVMSRLEAGPDSSS